MCVIVSRETLVSLYFYNAMTFEDIAEHYGHSVCWVKAQFRKHGIRALDERERGTRRHIQTKLDQFDPKKRVKNTLPKQYSYWCRRWDEFWEAVRVERGLEMSGTEHIQGYAEAVV